jgi:amino acid adenylation domain-containing protein
MIPIKNFAPIQAFRALQLSDGRQLDLEGYVRFEAAEVEQSIPARFEEQVRRHGARIALKSDQAELTYTALNRWANRLAHAVLEKSGAEPEPVVLLLDKEAPLFAAMLGVLKAGKFYVPLSTSYPFARSAAITTDSGARLIVTDNRNLSTAMSLAGTGVAVLNVEEVPTFYPDDNLDLPIGPDAYAYIIYTSGSTGTPKGVVDTHRNLLHNIRKYTNNHRVCATDRLACLNSCAFSNSFKDIYGSLLNGGMLLPYDIEKKGLAELADWLRDEEVTVLSLVATVFRGLVNALNKTDVFPHVRLVRVGSEAVTRHDLDMCRRHFGPDCKFANGYGTTETGTVSVFVAEQKHASACESVVPVGRPGEGMEVLLLGDDGLPVKPGEIGQIAVRSRYLSPGYWGKSELTAAAFLPHPEGGERRTYLTGDLGQWRADGQLLYRGRKDFQVKIRGNRIEVAEIELALLEISGVKEAAVIARNDQANDTTLVGYVVMQPGSDAVPVAQMRAMLSRCLPTYAIPRTIVTLNTLPLTSTGKLDRKALPAPPQDRFGLVSEYLAPRDEIEVWLAETWEELLDIKPIGVKDNFFEAGGHSLQAAELMLRVGKHFGTDLRLAALFEDGTIEGLARRIRGRAEPKRDAALVPIQATGTRPPFFCVHGIGGEVLGFERLAHHLGADQPIFAFQAPWLYAGTPERSIEAIAERYVGELLQQQPSGPYYLGGYSFGGAVAYEMAQRLQRRGHQVALLVLIDQRHPSSNRKWTFSHTALSGLLRNMPRWIADEGAQKGLRGLSADLVAKSPMMWKQLQRFFAPAAAPIHKPDVNEVVNLTGRSEEYRGVMATHYQALRAYQPKPYAGRVLLLRAEIQPLLRWQDTEMGWRELATDGVEVCVVPGNHDSIVKEPHVRFLAQELNAALSQSARKIMP